jgi:transposase-like protein
MPRMYPASVHRQIVQRLRSGEAVADIAVETGIAQATLFRWNCQGGAGPYPESVVWVR